MIETILKNWIPVLAIIGGMSLLVIIITACLIQWRKAGGGDIKAGIVSIDVDGEKNE